MSTEWTEWEKPWTRMGGVAPGYVQARELMPGQVVAVRSAARPYPSLFAPWWFGLVVLTVDDDVVTCRTSAGYEVDLALDKHPVATHWAVDIRPVGETT